MRVIAVLLVGLEFLVALTTSTTTSPCSKCENNDIDDTIDVRLYQTFERELLNNSRMLFAFKQAFYPVNKQAQYYNRGAKLIVISLKLNIKSYYSGNSYTNFSSEYRFQWTESSLLNTVNTAQLLALEPVVTDILYSRIVGSLYKKNVTLLFNFESLPCQATEDQILNTIAQLLSWIKVYTNFNGAPPIWDPEDQGYVTRWYNYFTSDILHDKQSERDSKTIDKCINYLFLLLNSVIPWATFKVGTNKGVARILSQLRNRRDIRRVYYSTAIVLSMIYIAYAIASSMIQISNKFPGSESCEKRWSVLCGIPHDTNVFKSEVEAFVIKMIIVPLATFAQLIVAILITKNSIKISHNKWYPKREYFLHTMAMWMILMSLQLVVGSMLLPICLFLIIDLPNTFRVIATTVLITVVLIILVTQLFSLRVRPGERAFSCMNISRFILRLTWFIVSFLCIGLTVTLYHTICNQLNEGPLGHIALTLLPSVVLSVIIWVIKKRFSRRWHHLKERESYQELE